MNIRIAALVLMFLFPTFASGQDRPAPQTPSEPLTGIEASELSGGGLTPASTSLPVGIAAALAEAKNNPDYGKILDTYIRCLINLPGEKRDHAYNACTNPGLEVRRSSPKEMKDNIEKNAAMAQCLKGKAARFERYYKMADDLRMKPVIWPSFVRESKGILDECRIRVDKSYIDAQMERSRNIDTCIEDNRDRFVKMDKDAVANYYLLRSFIDTYEKTRGECERQYGSVRFALWKTVDMLEVETLKTLLEQIAGQDSDGVREGVEIQDSVDIQE